MNESDDKTKTIFRMSLKHIQIKTLFTLAQIQKQTKELQQKMYVAQASYRVIYVKDRDRRTRHTHRKKRRKKKL